MYPINWRQLFLSNFLKENPEYGEFINAIPLSFSVPVMIPNNKTPLPLKAIVRIPLAVIETNTDAIQAITIRLSKTNAALSFLTTLILSID